jgi:uncharacterized protein YbjT (DUF2867 family)
MSTNKKPFTLAMIGCSGYIGAPYIDEFIKLGVNVKVLARNPQAVSSKFQEAEVIEGSMLNKADVVSTMQNTNAAFLITPIGPRNNKQIELNAAEVTIRAAKELNLPHLIFVSVLIPKYPSGVALLDAKPEIEQMMAESGIPWTSIRCGTYMEDVIQHRFKNLEKGVYFFPVDKEKEFSLTCQRDVPRFVKLLLQNNEALNGAIDFIEPNHYTPDQIAETAAKALGWKIKASGKYPFYLLLHLAWPILYLRKHRLSTIIPLIKFFNQYGYRGNPNKLAENFPEFKLTTLSDYLESFTNKHKITHPKDFKEIEIM